jgi:serine/threonine protein kinase
MVEVRRNFNYLITSLLWHPVFYYSFFEEMEKNGQWESLRELTHDPNLASRYELIAVIGEGCFGKVLKAKSKRTGKLCALKLEHFRRGRTRTVLRN